MGLLDDAIREHLELKRKHGAPDEELSRQETEALGPARRDFANPEAGVEGDAVPAPAEDAAADLEPAAPSEPPSWLEEDEPAPAARPEPAVPREALEAATPVDPPAAREPVEHAAEAVEPTVPEEPLPPRRESDVATQDFDALSAADEPAEASDEDVLEETPDFLQDTPEHDRLWFEQKPPRDFDFDD